LKRADSVVASVTLDGIKHALQSAAPFHPGRKVPAYLQRSTTVCM